MTEWIEENMELVIGISAALAVLQVRLTGTHTHIVNHCIGSVVTIVIVQSNTRRTHYYTTIGLICQHVRY